MNNWQKVSVIILNAFQIKNLEECLESLKKTNYPDFEIIVVDCLTEGISAFINSKFPDVKLLALTTDIGPAAMHNVGIDNSDSRSKYVAFLDNDTVIEPDWLKELILCIESDEKIGAVQSKILLYDKPHLLNTKGNRANYLAVGWPDGYNTPDDGDLSIREIAFPSGASMIMRKDILVQVGKYDEDYFIYADDMDAGFRIFLAGYKIVYCPKSVIYHKYRFLKSSRNFYYLNRNRLTTFFKIYESKFYIRLLPPFIFYEFSVLCYAILNGYLFQLLKAYCNNLQNIKILRNKRSIIRKYKRLSDKEIISKLDAEIDFPEISGYWAVKFLLNPFLSKYKTILLKI